MIKRLIGAVAVAAALFFSAAPSASQTVLPLPTGPAAIAVAGPVVSATNILVVASSTLKMYVYFAGVQASGTNTTSTYYFVYGRQVSSPCDTGTVKFMPMPSATPATAGLWSYQYSDSPLSSAAAGVAPSSAPFVVPAGNQVCLVTAGTTIAVYGVVYYVFQ